MKICHLTNYYPGCHDHVGGAERACAQMVRSYTLAGHDNLILTSPVDRAPDCADRVKPVPLLEQLVPPPGRLALEATKWYLLQADPLALGAIAVHLRRYRPDLVLLHNCQFLTLGVLPLCRKLGIPTQMAIYDYWLFCPLTILAYREREPHCHRQQGIGCLDCLPRRQVAVQRLLLGMRRPLMRWFESMVDQFIVLSASSRAILERQGVSPGRIAVVHLYQERQLPPHDEAQCAPETVLFVGWIQPRKGLHVVLRAMAELLRRRPQARLRVVGGGVKFGEAFQREVQQLSGELSGRVELLGRVSDQALEQEMQRAAALVVAEQWPNMSPVIVMEGMARGKPLVGSRIGGIPEFVRHEESGLLVDHDQPQQYAAALERLLSDRSLACRLGATARQRAGELFDPARSSAALDRAASRLLRPASGDATRQ